MTKKDVTCISTDELQEGMVDVFADFDASENRTGGSLFVPGPDTGMAIVAVLMDIEQFVKDIQGSDDFGFSAEHTAGSFSPSFGRPLYPWTPLPLGERYFQKINAFSSVWTHNLSYSPYVDLFFEVHNYSSLPGITLTHPDAVVSMCGVHAQQAEMFNKLIGDLRLRVRSKHFKDKIFARIQQGERNFESCRKYVDAIFAHVTSKLVVVRVDVFYRHGARQALSLNEARKDMDRLLDNRRKNGIFEHCVGYIRKLEYGVKKGYHFHTFFFFDGHHVEKDPYLAYRIGEYWQTTITKGAGSYYNCNQSKRLYKRIGIGTIAHDDLVTRGNLLYAILYVCKVEQQLHVRDTNGPIKTIVRGAMPTPRTTRKGRPRRATEQPAVAVPAAPLAQKMVWGRI